jgi:hypothetical protein
MLLSKLIKPTRLVINRYSSLNNDMKQRITFYSTNVSSSPASINEDLVEKYNEMIKKRLLKHDNHQVKYLVIS